MPIGTRVQRVIDELVESGAASAVVHVLVEQGKIDYDTRLVELWPEFGAHRKEAVTVRHVLTHSTGRP
ncbi:MAG TPA: serine hydrolase domain-containing protein [Pseudonocardiaceae bacterium]|jgi:CubicO group peptidase (beta-lactamase class C family)|nr:serine hydrolase domain-containing protein [Pseudonocardiaceae bacterium]